MTSYEKIKVFLLGMITALLIFSLIGDNNSFADKKADEDRYQLQSPSTDVFFVIDTYTGEVYRSELSAQDKSKLFSTFKYEGTSKHR